MAFGAVGLTSGVAHAYPSTTRWGNTCFAGPSIQAQGGVNYMYSTPQGWFDVWGTCFTAGGGVWVGVFASDGSVIASQNFTAYTGSDNVGHVDFFDNGQPWDFGISCYRNARAIAYDWTTGTYSNSVTFDAGCNN